MRKRYAITAVALVASFVAAQPPKSATFGDTRATATRVDVASWRSSHPQAFSDATGKLVGVQVRFEADMVALAFAIDYKDATKSDITLRCGSVRVNPFKLAMIEPQTKKLTVDTPGGYFQKDGRLGSIVMQRRSLETTWFFDVPSACTAGEKLELHMLFDDQHAVILDAGAL